MGPGTGQVTRRLLELGAEVVAVEPDARLAEFLRGRVGDRAQLVEETLEEAELEDGAFDLAVAASSFHCVDEAVGLASLRRALRPGGWIAIWWTSFGDETRPDPLRDAVDPLFEDVSFTYPTGVEPALVDVSLEVDAGEVVALVGENGSGKTTLAKLLARLYSPDAGSIRWDPEIVGGAKGLPARSVRLNAVSV